MTPNWQFTMAIVLIVWPLMFIYGAHRESGKTPPISAVVFLLSVTAASLGILMFAWGLRLLWLLWINPPQLL